MATALLKCDKFKGDKGKYGTYPVNMLTANLSRVMNSLAWGRQKWQTWPAEHFRSSSLVAVLFANPPRTCCWCQPAETSAPQTVIERDPPCQLSQILDLPKGRSYMTCITHKYTCNTHKYKYINTVYIHIYIHIFQLYFIYYTSRAARGGGGSFKNRKRIGEIGCCESRMTKRKHWWIWLTAELSSWLTD